jgi:hypothetical protein
LSFYFRVKFNLKPGLKTIQIFVVTFFFDDGKISSGIDVQIKNGIELINQFVLNPFCFSVSFPARIDPDDEALPFPVKRLPSSVQRDSIEWSRAPLSEPAPGHGAVPIQKRNPYSQQDSPAAYRVHRPPGQMPLSVLRDKNFCSVTVKLLTSSLAMTHRRSEGGSRNGKGR